MNGFICDQISTCIADVLHSHSRHYATVAASSSLPSVQVHQAVLFFQPFLEAPIKNIHSLYCSFLAVKSVKVLTPARHQTHTQSHLPQWSDCPRWPCWSLWRGAEVHKTVKSSHQSSDKYFRK